MAAGANNSPAVNGTETTNKALELAIDLPHSPGLKLNLHLTILANSTLLFLTSTSSEAGTGAVSMGSFVYALPDVSHVTYPWQEPSLSSTTAIQSYTAHEHCIVHCTIIAGLRSSNG